MSDAGKRTFDATVEIDAPIEQVWKAISEGDEIAKWFALDAKVEPGVGGSVWLSWGPDFAASSPIEIWEPGRRLRTTHDTKDENDQPVKMAVDYYLESVGGKTRVRIVHSGFGFGARWDGEFDAITSGWKIFMQNLRVYIETHPGQPGLHAWKAVPSRDDPDATWAAMIGASESEAPLRISGEIARDSRFELRGAGDLRLSGTLDLAHPKRVIGGRIDELDGGVFRLAIGAGMQACELHLLAWGVEASAFERARDGLIEMIEARVGKT